MTSTRVTPAPVENKTVSDTILHWPLKNVERNGFSPRTLADPDALIDKTVRRQLARREVEFQLHLPFSWLRLSIGLVSLGLVFTEVLRSGLGVSDMRKYYPSLQPDEVLSFGTTWNYSVFAATKSEAVEDESLTANAWSYKSDSTSIVWRAFAAFLKVSAFPDCLLYRSVCPSSVLSGDVAFQMIDSLENAVSKMNSSQGATGPVTMSIRTENKYVDRLHQFLLPQFFTNINWRTNQALYYSPELLAKINAHEICFPSRGRHIKKPRFCYELWTNFRRSCATTDTQCQAVGLLYVHAMKRLHDVQARFPNAIVDLTFMESQEDLQVCRGGLSSLGFRCSDVTTVIRARTCEAASSCETIYVDDYRYETALLTSDVVQWYRLVVTLRVIGQAYFWVRGVGLILSFYYVYGEDNNKETTTRSRLWRTSRLLAKIPTQAIVYGSPFPVVCYVLAHLLDVPFTYNVLEDHFVTKGGVLNIKLQSFVSYAVVQMRSVWVFALVWQLIVGVWASHWLTRSQRVSNGVVGVPEFLLSLFSSMTLPAQYRLTSIRSAQIIKMMELPRNLGRSWVPIKYQYSFANRGSGSKLLGGVLIDIKFLICLVLAVAAVLGVRVLLLQLWRIRAVQHRKRFVLVPTPVPYTAGVLWPTVSMAVHWTSEFFCIQEGQQQEQQLVVKSSLLGSQNTCKKVKVNLLALLVWIKRQVAKWLRRRYRQDTYAPTNPYKEQLAGTKTVVDPLQFIQHQMKCLHGRSDDVEANVAFMNAILLSDPLVYLRMRHGRDHTMRLAYYQSLLRPHQVVLLPVAVVGEHNEYTRNLKLLRRVNTADLSWSELVQCG